MFEFTHSVCCRRHEFRIDSAKLAGADPGTRFQVAGAAEPISRFRCEIEKLTEEKKKTPTFSERNWIDSRIEWLTTEIRRLYRVVGGFEEKGGPTLRHGW